jgi:hypothetical protein
MPPQGPCRCFVVAAVVVGAEPPEALPGERQEAVLLAAVGVPPLVDAAAGHQAPALLGVPLPRVSEPRLGATSPSV